MLPMAHENQYRINRCNGSIIELAWRCNDLVSSIESLTRRSARAQVHGRLECSNRGPYCDGELLPS